MKKHPRRWAVPLRFAVIFVILFVAGYASVVYLIRAIKQLDYFTIQDIIVKESNLGDFSYLKGRNIFTVDLKKESEYIFSSYPVYRKVRLIRILPNQLFVDFLKRRPLAYVKLYRYFYVDEEVSLWSADTSPEELDLPVIVGLDTKIFGPKTGQHYTIPSLVLALDIIKEVNLNKTLKQYKLKRIDAKNADYVSCFVPTLAGFEDVEIRINQEDMKDKINILAGLVSQLKSGLSAIKYIDLRFKEPVIKLKDAS